MTAASRLLALSESEWITTFGRGVGQFDAIRQAAEELKGEKLATPGLSRMEQARNAWEAHLERGAPIEGRERAALCWEPEIACSGGFLRLLNEDRPLRRRALRGLLSSYHEKWGSRSSEIERILENGLNAAAKSRGVVGRWSANRRELIGATAPIEFATGCLAERESVSRRLSRYGLSPSGEFARLAAAALAELVSAPERAPQCFDFAADTFFPDDDNIIDPKPWGVAFHRLVTNKALAVSEETRQRLIDLALKTRGLTDPRLRQAQWQNVPVGARDLVVHWLSEEELLFFFDLLMEGRSDFQQRAPFWRKYLARAIRSRVVVGDRDYQRLRPKLDEIRARGRTFARVHRGHDPKASAFIMDFGEVVIVEFSRENSACYIYKNETRQPYFDFTQQVFGWYELKNRRRGDAHSHVAPPENWHRKFQAVLAQHGVRPE